MKKLSLILIIAVLSTLLCFPSSASTVAEDLSDSASVSGKGYQSFKFLTDKNDTAYKKSSGSAEINIKSENGIGSIYVIFKTPYGKYSVTDCDSGSTLTVGENGFQHEFIDISALFNNEPENISLTFSSGAVTLGEIYIFSKGEVPSFVQKWSIPLENKTDLLLFSTHGDDDQLYFAGLLPHYAVYKGYNVQVVYMTDHRQGSVPRSYEMLNGLWAVGIKNYPVFGQFADFRIDDKQATYDRYRKQGVSKDDLLKFTVEQIRRFKPLVTVGHDFNGEYGHGMHQVYAELVAESLKPASDGSKFTESAEKYGIWQVQKAYFHLYHQNKITLSLDEPKDCFNGLSAFQMAQKKGFPCHKSQLQYSFNSWLNGKNGEITKATQIKSYNPAEYGLFYSSVGNDTDKNDMFENITPRSSETPKPPADENQSEIPSTSSTDTASSEYNEGQPTDDSTGASATEIVTIAVLIFIPSALFIAVLIAKNKKR